jgi:hypothetical protein
MPLVQIAIAPAQNTPNALQVAARLRSARPAVYVDSTDADRGTLILVPTCLGIDDAPAIGAAFAAALTPVA